MTAMVTSLNALGTSSLIICSHLSFFFSVPVVVVSMALRLSPSVYASPVAGRLMVNTEPPPLAPGLYVSVPLCSRAIW